MDPKDKEASDSILNPLGDLDVNLEEGAATATTAYSLLVQKTPSTSSIRKGRRSFGAAASNPTVLTHTPNTNVDVAGERDAAASTDVWMRESLPAVTNDAPEASSSSLWDEVQKDESNYTQMSFGDPKTSSVPSEAGSETATDGEDDSEVEAVVALQPRHEEEIPEPLQAQMQDTLVTEEESAELRDHSACNLAHTGNNDAEEASDDGLPDLANVLVSAAYLFDRVEDKTKVTLKDIMISLYSEYNCKLPKYYKRAVKDKLADLWEQQQEQEEEAREEPLKTQPQAQSREDCNTSFRVEPQKDEKEIRQEEEESEDPLETQAPILPEKALYKAPETQQHDELPPDDEALKESSIATSSNKEPCSPKDTSNVESGGLPDLEAVLNSTEYLFGQVEDKLQVTVKDIMLSLNAEYNCKLPKSYKSSVREKLTELIIEGNDNAGDEDSDIPEEEEMNVSDVGEVESEYEADQDADSDADNDKGRRRSKAKAKSRKPTHASTKEDSTSPPPRRARAIRAARTKAKTSAMRIHAEKLRKRRMEELRVVNEELQVNQSKEDQERAELIAAKFETDTDELRLQRFEHRFNLIQRLDQKRLGVIQSSAGVVLDITDDQPAAEVKEEDLDEESDSDDDMELEVVGGSKSLFALKPMEEDPLLLLSLADKKQLRPKANASMDFTGQKAQASPGRSLNARAALRNKLLSRQRKMGNMWLARELGYKTEKDHLRDCMQVEQRKKELVMEREKERLKANEKKLLRERLIAQGEEVELEESPESEDDQGQEDAEEKDEDDEETEMARALEQDDDEGEAETPIETAPCKEEINISAEDDERGLETQLLTTMADFGDAELKTKPQGTLEQVEVERSGVPTTKSENQTSGVDTKATVERIGGDVQDISTLTVEKTKDEVAETSTEAATTEVKEPENESSAGTMENTPEKPKGPRNSGWQAMLRKEAEQIKKMKKRKNGLVEEEADEEEEEEVAGLEDFGFKVIKKNKDGDDEEIPDDIDEDDLKGVVDELSDDEGDEDAGEKARKILEREEEKEKHKEMIRRMRDGYDGRRGGIAVGGAGARGIHRFDQLVAADNREDAKRLGLLNDDEVDSDQEDGEDKDKVDEEEDEGALLDKMLKDRFLHRSSVELEENFSDDEEPEEDEEDQTEKTGAEEVEDEKEQDRLAKRFAKRARMQRLIETFGHEEEWSQSRLIEEDTTLKEELSNMKNVLSLKRTQNSMLRNSSVSTNSTITDRSDPKRQKTKNGVGGFLNTGGSLAIALQASRRKKTRTSFRRGSTSDSTNNVDMAPSIQRNIGYSHVVFHSSNSKKTSKSNRSNASIGESFSRPNSFPPRIGKMGGQKKSRGSESLWSKAIAVGFKKK